VTSTPPPGWYPDPFGGAGTRWWNGAVWQTDYQPPSMPTSPGAQSPRALVVAATAVVPASPETLFRVLADPSSASRFSPHWKVVEQRPLVTGGWEVRMTARTNSMRLDATVQTTVFHPPTRLVLTTRDVRRNAVAAVLRARLADRVEWDLAPHDGGTSATATHTWTRLPLSLRLFPPMVRRRAQRAVARQLRLLQEPSLFSTPPVPSDTGHQAAQTRQHEAAHRRRK
jgi:uncharacterized protein YndB with AHSA1/START domain